jgi:hypothetical protein
MATETQGLSPKAKEILQRNAELRQRDNKFIKIGPGEKKVLTFNPEKIDQVEAEFNGRKSTRFRYSVMENGNNDEKYLEVGKRTSEDIDSFLTEGANKLKVEIWLRYRYAISHTSCLKSSTIPHFLLRQVTILV